VKVDSFPLEELGRLRIRILVIGIAVVLVFSLLAARLWYLQVIQGSQYADYAQGNRIRIVSDPGLRGVIHDRNGVVLAENRPAYQLQLIREDTPDWRASVATAAEALHLSHNELVQRVKQTKGQVPFQPIVLVDDLDYQKAMLVETYQEEFRGISIVVKPRRYYPNKAVLSHALGYVGITSEKLAHLPAKRRFSSEIEGKAGVELVRNKMLIGTDGGRQVEVDHLGRELKILSELVPSIPGKDLHLTIDARLQKIAFEAMGEQTGAVIVMNPKTGEILALSSLPSYDPNLFSGGIDPKEWQTLLNNPQHPLENKAIQGLYPLGSIFKLVTAYAGLELGAISPDTTHTCNGKFYIPGRSTPYRCWLEEGHGTRSVVDAIKQSCNVFFYNVGTDVGVDALHEYASWFGLGKQTGFILPNEKAGLIPSTEWKRRTFGEPWYLGETPTISIGQGYVSVTPLQVLNMVNIVANNGVWAPPRLLLDESPRPSVELGLSQELLGILRQGMVAVVNAPGGTATRVRFADFTVGGKTATSQVISLETRDSLSEEDRKKREFQDHAWFVAYGPAEDPEISVLVLVEHGGGGSRVAAPVARAILQFYIDTIATPRQNARTTPSGAMPPTALAYRTQLQTAFLP
jgi:penicillin-binding protein 2